MQLPPAVIFLNADINDVTKQTLVTQLYIDQVVSFDEYNGGIEADPNYPDNIRLNGMRLLVILPTFRDFTNRETADIVLFYNQGQVTVEKNKYGPPGLSLPIQRINIYELLRDMKSKYVKILPPSATKPPHATGQGGILAEQYCDPSGVHDPNPDNMYNNIDFINRK